MGMNIDDNMAKKIVDLGADGTLTPQDLAEIAAVSKSIFTEEEAAQFSKKIGCNLFADSKNKEKVDTQTFGTKYGLNYDSLTDEDIATYAKDVGLNKKEITFVKQMNQLMRNFNQNGKIELNINPTTKFLMTNEGQRTLDDGTLQQGYEAAIIQELKVRNSVKGNKVKIIQDLARGKEEQRFFDKAGNEISTEQFYEDEKLDPTKEYRINEDGTIVKLTPFYKAMAYVGVVAGTMLPLHSCTKFEQVVNIHIDNASELKQYIDEAIAQQRALTEEVLNAALEFIKNQIQQGKQLDAILKALGDNNTILNQILGELVKGNKLLLDIRNGMELNNKQNDEIIKITLQILAKLDNIEKEITAIKNKFPGLSSQLNAILAAITNNPSGSNDPTAVLAMLEEVIRLLKSIDKSTSATEETTRKILAAIQKLGTDQAANFAAIIEAINKNDGDHGPDYTNLLNLILAKLDKIDQHNQAGYEALLNKMDEILKAIKDHHVTIDVTGTVTCNCNCGNNSGHEGIIDDINGLIS